MNKNLTKKIAAISIAIAINFLYMPAYAASFSAISDTMTRQMEGQTSSHDILFTLSGSNSFEAGDSISIDFGEDSSYFAVAGAASVAGDFDFNDGTERTIINVGVGAPSCTNGVNNVAVGIDDTTGIVTFLACTTYTASATGATINIEYGTAAGGTNRVTNPATAGSNTSFVIPITGGPDSGSFAVVITDTSVGDQVVLSASVDPSITFSLSANTSSFGTLVPGVVDTAGTNITLTVGTNGNGGYSITVRDAGNTTNPGLYNALATAIIGSADGTYAATADLNSVLTGYGLQISCTAGCTTGTHVASDWRQGTNTVGGLTIADKNVATYASSTSTDHTLEVVHKAKASASTKAGSYTDTLTYVATATF